VLGGFLVYLMWAMSEPVSAAIFAQVSRGTVALGWGPIPEIDARAAQMRVFVLGLVIWLSLRFAPKGLLPEVIRRHV
jgi:branched-chain amino acid transport system permease protein